MFGFDMINHQRVLNRLGFKVNLAPLAKAGTHCLSSYHSFFISFKTAMINAFSPFDILKNEGLGHVSFL